MKQGSPQRDKLRRSVAVAGCREDKDDQAVFEQFCLQEACIFISSYVQELERTDSWRT